MNKFETYDFKFSKIIKQANLYSTEEEKLTYLSYIKKELKRVIRCFQNKKIFNASEDCLERENFFNDQIKYLSEEYGKNDKRIPEAIKDEMRIKIKELKICLNNIEDEIEFIIKFEKTSHENELNEKNKELEKGVKKVRPKIKLSNELIAEEVIKLWDNGVVEFEEIYKLLSENSETIFKVKLTQGQIKGRYQRYSTKHKDYKREKY